MLVFFLAAVLAYQVLRCSLLVIVYVLVQEFLATKALFGTAAYIGFGVPRRETLVAAGCAHHLLFAATNVLYYISRCILGCRPLALTAATLDAAVQA